MSNDIRNPNHPRAPLSFAARGASRSKRELSLSLDADQPKAGTPLRGSDPYNTSGSFDRTKNWSRIGKR